MGLYIKGLDMPKESILMTVHNGSAYVIPVGEDEGKTYEVIEVKIPHGRLIDADKTLDRAWQDFYKHEDEQEKKDSSYLPIHRLYDQSGFECCQQTIVNAPTVIEAEEGVENDG